MKGGYLEDRFINGCQAEDGYYFIHWSIVDIFVYFSHHLVTIPPCSWISAAHRNGVKILGTFITEWDEGLTICESILADEASVHEICMQLVKIAVHHNFDGWLINIENKLKANQISLMEEFVHFLTQRMHDCLPHSLVIWYDSIIKTGDLKWQNALNENNRIFFCKCDGIFLNYNWKEEHLQKSVSEAGHRKTDVFVGVDVFGRGCLGGGGFSTDIAVTEARKFGLSVAIFAPGWVYECLGAKDFKKNQNKFWNRLFDFCAPKKILKLPYYSSFCPGYGKKMFRNGNVISCDPWFNLSIQQPQPTFHNALCTTPNGLISVFEEEAFNGGGCLKLTANTVGKLLKFEILSTHFLLDSALVVSYVFKPLSEHVDVSLVLNIQSNGMTHKLFLVDKSTDPAHYTKEGSLLLPATKNELVNSNLHLKNQFFDQSWIKRVFLLEPSESVIDSVSVCAHCWNPSEESVSVLLGEIEIFPFQKRFDVFCRKLNCSLENEEIVVNCTLEWTQDPCVLYSDLYITQNSKPCFLCTTSQFCYEYNGNVNSNVDCIEFRVHPHSSVSQNFDPVSMVIELNLS